MADIGIIEKFKARHGTKSHEHDFKVEIVLSGKIDAETGYVGGIDHHHVTTEIKKIISGIQNQDLKIILEKAGYKSSGNESIASYFIKLLKEKFPVKYVKVWEDENRYATVYREDI